MSESKHTPGPWEFLEAGRTEEKFNVGRPFTIAEANAPHNDIANVYSADDETVSITREQAISNARLIAAAPDLLKHAQSLLNGIDTGLVRLDTDADETLANTMSGLRAAIAKATGHGG
jgi:hypothetical protein